MRKRVKFFKKFKKIILVNSIFWFRRDLRVEDNKSLIKAVKNSEKIFPIFILDPHFLSSCPKNDARIGFLRESLEILDKKLKKISGSGLNIFYGEPEKIFSKILYEGDIEKIFCSKSISLAGGMRDKKISALIGEKNFITVQDTLLVEPEQIETRKVFSAFYRQWEKIQKFVPENRPLSFTGGKFSFAYETIEQAFEKNMSFAKNFYWHVKENISVVDFFHKNFPNYDETRNNVFDTFGTTKISPYLRFGIVSVREIFNFVKNLPFDTTVYEKELAWREFWVHIHSRFPETKNMEFQEKRRNMYWSSDDELFEKWENGETGYPIIDAAMKQLNRENWMHNRARMFTASFLTKNLHIDWRKGERYFAEKLLDYDDPINIGNWQWSASVGADPKPLRIFSPVLQAQRFDPNAEYIKKYLPELHDIEPKKLHDPHKFSLPYISPIVDAKQEAKYAKQRYMNAGVLF